MPPLHLLIKPASGQCNMRCKYCFYADVADNRDVPSYGMMELSTLETLVRRAFDYAEGECTFAFQGGEPTLRGLDYFQSLIEYVGRYNTKGLPVHYAIQTNGLLLDGRWATFFAENRFLVGLSLDGIKQTHDACRVDAAGRGTYSRVMHAVTLMNNHHVDFNLLTVVNAFTAEKIGKIYGFYKRNGLRYQQYIPCLDPLGEKRGQHPYSLTPKMYGDFLRARFDLWYADVSRGEFAYDRYFENLVGMLLGYMPESCGMIGRCTRQNVIEADGSVYPCDFYVLDQYRLGNLLRDDFDTIARSENARRFIRESEAIDESCRACRWFSLCRGGCRRDKEGAQAGVLERNYYCGSYRDFFAYAYPRLTLLARRAARDR